MAINDSALAQVRFNEQGLVCAVVQSAITKRVLMVAWMNANTLGESIEVGQTVFWSRSRNERWHKGATSGNVQDIVSIEVDCDSDSLLIHVIERGAACHNGTESCFDSSTLFISPDSAKLVPEGISVDEVLD